MNEKMRRMVQEIMLTVKANNIPVTGELWFTLVFRTESELMQICQELNIRTDNL